MSITDIKNIAKKKKIKLTEHGKSKTKQQLILEINKNL